MQQKKPINLKSWITSRLRGQSYKWPPRNEALVRARIERGLYKCSCCRESFKRDNVQIDHIKPVVPFTGWDSFDGFISRLFCDVDGFQIICIICHDIKTATEDTIRARHNANKKAEEKLQKKLDKKKKE